MTSEEYTNDHRKSNDTSDPTNIAGDLENFWVNLSGNTINTLNVAPTVDKIIGKNSVDPPHAEASAKVTKFQVNDSDSHTDEPYPQCLNDLVLLTTDQMFTTTGR